ncbi:MULTISPECIES: DUF475 domain-containing protein [unclassified Paracoccus (in: a-proteobacteria)]|uniref:DUF475 domain-containing protein n=1 Tax=unclassified Paracoccus (in: a-proteobacteria) TaxID=2688777 RepID=UPI0012B3627E|nr:MULTISPECIES: DUF475 domain-containing protein [unclassified Paracoccus (in: a-proteobacteria)]UXU75166.1 DUF475 domain-containing protein [Paracoccus sp. SMMA_5]UXU81068.1 DUF475 domain-containing protein [Paracoccus sp. SMMA_5_TC]
MRSTLSYLVWPLIVTGIGLVLAGALGWQYHHSQAGVLAFFLIAAILAVLEISLSFDNAIVNAQKLKQMTPKWQRRFLTWGIIIAVFGMRVIFPLLVVVIAARLGPWQAVRLAATQPQEYSRIIHEAHLPIAAFGGSFLMLVALNYFFDEAKDVDWIKGVEAALRKLGEIRGMEVGFVLACILVVVGQLPAEKEHGFIVAAIWGVITYLGVDMLGHVLDQWGASQAQAGIARGGLGAFLYLEVLDASFSFDGVIGAFALTQNLFLIAIGLGIGAMYVRSMTVMLVERGTLAEFRYLEHGAFWSIFVLSVLMFAQTLRPIPEVLTGLLGAGFIGTAFLSSLAWRRRQRDR